MDLKCLVACSSEAEAHHLRMLLEAQDIRASVQGGLLSQVRPEIPMTHQTLAQIWVFESDLPQATTIARDYFDRVAHPASRPVNGPDWTCLECHETVESHFEICWNCQSPKPEPM